MLRPFHFRLTVRRNSEQGYILLTLLLMVALMAFVAMVTWPTLKFNMQRDREEEMIHRGVQYSNAIRRFYKKFGRYPTKIDDLLSSNNIKFLRKRYKDPMNCKAGTCQDFKLLYFSDVQTSISGFGGGMIPGANPVGGAVGGLNGAAGASPFAQNNSFGGGNNSFGGNTGFGSNNSFGANSNSSFGQNQAQTQQNQPSQGNQPAGSDSTQTGDQSSSSSNNGTSGTGNNPGNGPTSGTNSSSPFGTGQIIGGPIVGVASATKLTDPTIREFNHKKKYKDWLFVYDPAQDRGQLITTPYQPQMIGSQGIPNVNGNGVTGGSIGQPMPGMQNNPNLPGASGFGNSNMNSPSSSPQQQ